MSNAAKTLDNLYRRGKVTEEGLRQAVEDGVITEAEYNTIVNG